MISAEQLAEGFERNVQIIQMQTAGLTHEQSLIQPPFRGNCMNWVLGHIAVHRDLVLRLLGGEPVLSERETARYGHGSAPVTGDGEDVLPLEVLLSTLECGQERLAAALKKARAENLAREMAYRDRTVTVGQRVFMLYFHDSYHTGQTELLRQLAGTDDHII